MLTIRTLRLAKTPPLPEHVRADDDCIWDSSDFIPDSEGFNLCEYTAQGSYPESNWEIMVRELLLRGGVLSHA